MRLEHDHPNCIVVTLSKRNVLSLLHKLEWEESAGTIVKLEENGVELVVRVEEDEVHYAHPSRGEFNFPGRMHEKTEARLRSECGAIDPIGHCMLPFGHPGECFMDSEINA